MIRCPWKQVCLCALIILTLSESAVVAVSSPRKRPNNLFASSSSSSVRTKDSSSSNYNESFNISGEDGGSGELQVSSIDHNNKRPWRVPSSDQIWLVLSGFLNSMNNNLPTKRIAVTGAAAMLVGHTIHKMYTSEPVRRAFYFWRHAGPIVVHYKFTQWWLTIQKADKEKRDTVYEELHNKYCHPSNDIMLHLRGLFCKIGQILSSRPDFMPTQYVECFADAQDSIPAWDTEMVRNYAINALRENCPVFDEYEDLILDEVALGSASIGQVHRGILIPKADKSEKQVGKEVAVKIMHQGAKARFKHDFQIFRWLCRVALPTWMGLLDVLEEQVMTEFNYLREAASLKEVRNNVRKSPYRKYVCVPEPMEELCCKEVLVMEMLHGKKLIDSIQEQLTSVIGDEADEFLKRRRHETMTGEDVGSMEILHRNLNSVGKMKLLLLIKKCRKVIDLLVDVHGYQIFRTGTWNGDPHFGNCLQLDDGRLGLIDYGQTRRMNDSDRKAFANVVVSLEESRLKHHDGTFAYGSVSFDTSRVADAMRDAGFELKNNNDDEMMTQYARLFFDCDEESEKQGYQIPQEYFHKLMTVNPLVKIPDSAIFVGRTSLLFRGMGSAIGSGQIRTAKRWLKHAKKALEEDN